MKENDLISVVVPVYRVEKSLERCVNSLLSQTYSSLEIILVDDGSPDKSGEICNKLAKQDSRVRVIHKLNGGLSSARNAGIEASRGDYIGFVDSDDWIAADMYEYLIMLLKKYDADVAQIGIVLTDKYTLNVKQCKEEISIYTDKDILQHFMLTSTITGDYSVCRCLFKKEKLKHLFFREGKQNEDIDFKYRALTNCKRLVDSNLNMYFYYQATDSITTSGLKAQDFDLYDAAEELYKLTCYEQYGEISFLGKVKKARTAFSLLSKIAYYGVADPVLDKKEIVKRLTREHRENLSVLLKSPMKVSRKIAAILLAINFKALEWPLKFLKLIYAV